MIIAGWILLVLWFYLLIAFAWRFAFALFSPMLQTKMSMERPILHSLQWPLNLFFEFYFLHRRTNSQFWFKAQVIGLACLSVLGMTRFVISWMAIAIFCFQLPLLWILIGYSVPVVLLSLYAKRKLYQIFSLDFIGMMQS